MTVDVVGQVQDDCFPSTLQFHASTRHNADNEHPGGIRAGLSFGSSSRGPRAQFRYSGSTKVDCQGHTIRWTSAGQDEIWSSPT